MTHRLNDSLMTNNVDFDNDNYCLFTLLEMYASLGIDRSLANLGRMWPDNHIEYIKGIKLVFLCKHNIAFAILKDPK